MYKDIWTWEKCRHKINSLKGRLGFADSPNLKFLKLTLFLETGHMRDEIRNESFPQITPSVYCILSGYAESQPMSETHKLISFSQLPGGQSYNSAFIRRAVQPIEKTFGCDAQRLWEAAKLLASANMLFDSSASNYLSTEQLAMLGELTSAILRHAHEAIT